MPLQSASYLSELALIAFVILNFLKFSLLSCYEHCYFPLKLPVPWQLSSGYVGLPLSVESAKPLFLQTYWDCFEAPCNRFLISSHRLNELRSGLDRPERQLRELNVATSLHLTNDLSVLASARCFHSHSTNPYRFF